jgi:hypothetical protein
MTQFIVWVSFGFAWGRAHDQHSMNQLIRIELVEIGLGVELFGRHQHAI